MKTDSRHAVRVPITISRNLVNPKKIGFKTILINSKFHPDKKDNLFSLKEVEKKYIDYIVSNLEKFLSKINLDIIR